MKNTASAGAETSTNEVLILMSDLGGGTGNHVLQMAARWWGGDWKPALASTSPRTSRVEPSLPVESLDAPPGPSVYPIRQFMRYRQIRRVVAERRPAILHSYFFWPILYGRLLRMTGAVSHLVENREDLGFNWGRHERAWLRLTRSIPDRVICVSEAVKRAAVDREGIDPETTIVVHNGVQIPKPVPSQAVRALRQELHIPADAPVVGMVANLNRRVKGPDRFLAVARDILDRNPEVRFVVVGLGGEGDFRAALEREGLADRVVVPGYREDVDVFYGMMSVSILTSRSEGLSITLLESMAHGLPVVATDVGGNGEVIREGLTGFLVPVDDTRTFAERVVKILDDEALRGRMGSAGRERVRTRFSLERTAAQYLSIYQQVMEQRS